MTLDYSIDDENMIVSISVSGETADNDWYSLFDKLKNDNRRKEEMNVLFDFRKHKSVVSTDVVYKLTDLMEKKEERIKWALIISRKVSLGMAYMAAVLLEKKNIEIKTFGNEKDAMEWLNEKC